MNLESLRSRIDELDLKILELLSERAGCAQKIWDIKRGSQAPVYVPERESNVLDRLIEANPGPYPNEAICSIYREIISATRALEKMISVAFLGPRDTFSHMAALSVFGASADYRPLPSFTDIFTEVERGRIDYGVVPVESSMGGSVSDILDLFITSDLNIVNEVMIHVTQNLLAKCPLDAVERVYSKDNALIQCRSWLRANLPRAELIEAASTAEAARRAAEEPGSAAIASALAADTYQLQILAAGIEDAPHNFTRFFVVGRQKTKPTGHDKSAILLSVKDRPGALYNLLLPFYEAGVNLTRIESRPSKQKAWEYVFFIDLLGHVEDPKVKQTLDIISDRANLMKVLGSFPSTDQME